MSKIAVVVLHYETIEDTLECVNSLLNQKYDDFDIIVVDNGSIHGRIQEYKKDFADNDRIVFLRSDENLGFAKGNNLGFEYAKNNLKSDIIILANNDLVFKQDSFLAKVDEACLRERFDVAGPKIISLVDGMNQNPVARGFRTTNDVKKKRMKLRILQAASYIGMDTVIKRYFSKPVREFDPQSGGDYQLFGACLIFANRFLKERNGLYPGTFMYVEEDILRWQIESEQMDMYYLDTAVVYHKEGSSTGSVYKKNRARRQFFYKYSIESIELLLSLMREKE